MRRFQGFGNLPGNGQCLVRPDRPLRDALGECRGLRPAPSRGRGTPSRPFEAIDLRDVGMIERGKRLRLPVEAGQPLGVMSESVGQNLDGDLTPKRGIERAIDFTHPARAERAARIS